MDNIKKKHKGLHVVCYGIFSLAMLPAFCWSQVVNSGDLYVMHETQFSSVSNFENKATGDFVNDGEVVMYADFFNDGRVDYDLGGLTRFQGNVVQSLGGNNSFYFYNVEFENDNEGLGFIVNNNIVSISGKANFLRGVVQSVGQDAAMVFEKDASHDDAYTGSYVEGAVLKYGNSSFEYPIGGGGYYKPLYISAPAGEEDGYDAQYFFENPDNEYPVDQKENSIDVIDGKGYWVVGSSVDSGELSITLGWDSNSTSVPLEGICIVRWDEGQDMWINEGGDVDVANGTVTAVLSIKNNNVFALGHTNDESGPGPGVGGEGVVVYNVLTPNGDGLNEYLDIGDVTEMPNNSINVYDRRGIKVYATSNYGENDNVFQGISERGSSGFLPADTYFYLLSYDDIDVEGEVVSRVRKTGFVYLITE